MLCCMREGRIMYPLRDTKAKAYSRCSMTIFTSQRENVHVAAQHFMPQRENNIEDAVSGSSPCLSVEIPCYGVKDSTPRRGTLGSPKGLFWNP